MPEGFDPTQERDHVRVGEVDIAFRRTRDVTVDRDIGDCRLRADQPVSILQTGFEAAEQCVSAADHLVGVELGAEHGDEPGRSWIIGNFTGSDGKPALHGCGAARIFRQPVGATSLLGEIDEDRVGVRNHHAVIFQYRHLPGRIKREKLGALVCAGLRSTSTSSWGMLSCEASSTARCEWPDRG